MRFLSVGLYYSRKLKVFYFIRDKSNIETGFFLRYSYQVIIIEMKRQEEGKKNQNTSRPLDYCASVSLLARHTTLII